MALTNYTELQAEIATHLRRAGLSSEIPTYIALAEARFNRKLRTREMMSVTSDTISSNTIALPSDWLAFHDIYIDGSPRQVLAQYTPDQQNTFDDGGSVKPYGYTIKGSNVYFFPDSDSDYTVGYTYYQKIPGLATNSTNWLLTNWPDIYLYGALLAATPAIKDKSMIATWAELLKTAVDELKESNEEDLYSGQLVMRPS